MLEGTWLRGWRLRGLSGNHKVMFIYMDWLVKSLFSFFYESALGLFPNTELVFDLKLPADFTPGNNDGEVDGFELVPFDKVLGVLQSDNMKTTSIPVALDFLIRKGVVNAENGAIMKIFDSQRWKSKHSV